MRNSLKKFFCFVVSFLLLLSCSLVTGAQQIAPRSEPADIERIITKTETISPDGLVTTVTYENIQAYIAFSRDNHPEIPDETLAMEILEYCGRSDMLHVFSGNRWNEVLGFESIIQNSEYAQTSKADGATPLSEFDAFDSAARIRTMTGSYSPITPKSSYVSDDGYMRLVTLALSILTPSGGDPEDHYYLAGAQAQWLIYPTYRYEDLLVIYYGNAVYDSSYDDYAFAEQKDYCGSFDIIYPDYTTVDCSAYQHEIWYDRESEGHSRSSETGTPAGNTTYFSYSPSDHVNITYNYASQGAIAVRVNFVTSLFRCLHDTYSSIEESVMMSYVLTRVYLQEYDTIFQAAYSHAWTGLGQIGLSVGTGGISFSTSLLQRSTDYYSSPTTVTY